MPASEEEFLSRAIRSRGGVWALMAALAAFASCAREPAIRTESSSNPMASFAELKTYAWMPGWKLDSRDSRVDDALLEKRIREAIDRVLGAKGYERKLAGRPDFFVAYHVALREKLDVTTMNSVYGFDPGWGWHHRGLYGGGKTGTGPHVASYDSGSLIIDFLEAKESTLIWRGSAQTKVDPTRDKERTKIERIDAVVDLMLKRFPRRAGTEVSPATKP